VACSQSQPVSIVLRNRASISKTSSLIKTQSNAVFQIRHGRAKAENDQHPDHAEHETNRIK
jgi:hypothetical protein